MGVSSNIAHRGLAVLALVGLLGMTSAPAGAAEGGVIAVGEVAPPPKAAGVDSAALKVAAEGEIKHLAATGIPRGRRVIVSLAVTDSSEAPVACTVHATLRDGASGTMLAIIEGSAASQGSTSAELKRRVAEAAVANAVRQFPKALAK